MAVDGYNWGTTRRWGWQSYTDIFAPTVREFGTLATALHDISITSGSASKPAAPARGAKR